MKKKFKKYLAILCSAVTIMSSIILPVSADEVTNTSSSTNNYGTLTEADVKNYIHSSIEH